MVFVSAASVSAEPATIPTIRAISPSRTKIIFGLRETLPPLASDASLARALHRATADMRRRREGRVGAAAGDRADLPIQPLIDLSIAVVVDAVADLGAGAILTAARVDRASNPALAVAFDHAGAADCARSDAPAFGAEIEALVDLPVAVVVDAVADLFIVWRAAGASIRRAHADGCGATAILFLAIVPGKAARDAGA